MLLLVLCGAPSRGYHMRLPVIIAMIGGFRSGGTVCQVAFKGKLVVVVFTSACATPISSNPSVNQVGAFNDRVH